MKTNIEHKVELFLGGGATKSTPIMKKTVVKKYFYKLFY